ncbi:SH3 and cysteine-rich domain-containing protein 2-like isoform X1 [Carcharodon carcharias]|uniref:SH3 and cysteine-rich domain-containing protein 2-like isoform X1 n=1 Tax=Carcharodon carcharias TaxID=13397 RepID=UPI001B7F18CB|nr:SH3 and cysteine-rich domain-containing protein 2-like isoform X1 [Carcharodon carcharias]
MTENNETESDPQNTELQRSPGSVCSHQETKLQRLKRSLSFKTILRSKSVENFFQRSNSEVKFPAEILPPPPTPPPTPPTAFLPEGPPINEPPTRKSHQASLPLKPVRTHNFQEFVFKKPTFCDICHHMIVGYSKRGWRCKLCKINAHPQCGEDASQQHCIGKLPMGFRRNFSSPLLIHEQYGFVKEAMPIATSSKVDPVYEALRFGTSLAQMSRSSFGSFSDSPTKHMGENGDIAEEPDLSTNSSEKSESQKDTTPLENGTVVTEAKKDSAISIQVRKSSVRKDMLQMHTYVALYKFMPQEHNDLGLQQGDRIVVTDDSNEDWWKGKIGDRVGFFPANFVQRVRPGERVWQCNRTFQGSKEQGQLPLKELQICVGRGEETNGFVKVCSGKKRGIVPADILKEI